MGAVPTRCIPTTHAHTHALSYRQLNGEMLSANARIAIRHGWESKWYEWPLNLRGLLYYSKDVEPGMTETVYLIGACCAIEGSQLYSSRGRCVAECWLRATMPHVLRHPPSLLFMLAPTTPPHHCRQPARAVADAHLPRPDGCARGVLRAVSVCARAS